MSNNSARISSLTEYSLLGQTGLRVSPLCLGAMTFGTESGWGADKEASRAIFRRYLEAGGNFIDTADTYTEGRSEEWLGEFMADAKLRERLVVATKFTFGAIAGDPNGGGNSRKTILRSVEGSLRRLRTDYIDLYWLHTWDMLTPVAEVLSTLDSLVKQGKVRYIGLSDVPAWYAARAQTLAEWRGWERVAALQLEYSLVSRNLEREHLPMMRELNMGLCVWSPLAQGFLSGKYSKEKDVLTGEGRIQTVHGSGHPVMDKFTSERNWKILDVLRSVSNELGRHPADVALNWVGKRPGVTSTIIGATRAEQLDKNLLALEWDMPKEMRQRLEEASRPSPSELDDFFSPHIQNWIRGGTTIRSCPRLP